MKAVLSYKTFEATTQKTEEEGHGMASLKLKVNFKSK